MINIAVIGASSLQAGELIRLLVNHPEVEIKYLYSPDYTGRPAASRHHGLIGEEIVSFTDNLDFSDSNLVFIADSGFSVKEFTDNLVKNPEIRIIDLSGEESVPGIDMSVGLSEINRKELVRGAKTARILTPLSSLALIALFPFALNSLLPSSISIDAAAPSDIARNEKIKEDKKQIGNILKKAQDNFSEDINIRISPNKSERVMRLKISFKCEIDLDEIMNIYDSIYDDHNFVFITLSDMEGREIEGTQKTVITVRKPLPELCELEIVGDCRMRGGAGDAVHVMNLFFALYEKIGLQLKPSRYGNSPESTSRPANWFG